MSRSGYLTGAQTLNCVTVTRSWYVTTRPQAPTPFCGLGEEPVPCGGGTKREVVDAVVRLIKGDEPEPEYLSEIEIDGNRITFTTEGGEEEDYD